MERLNPTDQILNDLKHMLKNDVVLTYDCGDGAVLYRFRNVPTLTVDDVSSFASRFGLGHETRNEIDSVFSVSYYTEEYGRFIFLYDGSDASLSLIADLEGKPYPDPTAGEPKCPVRFWQYEIDHSLIDCGMCYIFQLSDGSFFIIDSAHQYSVRDDYRIADFLRQHTPDGMPVTVSGWFFSHGHDDHIAKFMDVLQYQKDVNVEAVYENFVPEESLPTSVFGTQDRTFTRRFRALIKKNHVPCYKTHALDTFRVKDLMITVLCTHEDLCPNPLENYNDSSTVIMAEVGDDKICFPGDAGHVLSAILERRFPKYLSCDIVQQAHHGHFGTTPAFYDLAHANAVLFPTTKIKYDEEFDRYPANGRSVEIAKHCFIASDGTVEFTFPLKENRIKQYPDEVLEDFNGVLRLWNYSYTEEYKNALRARFEGRQSVEYFDW